MCVCVCMRVFAHAYMHIICIVSKHNVARILISRPCRDTSRYLSIWRLPVLPRFRLGGLYHSKMTDSNPNRPRKFVPRSDLIGCLLSPYFTLLLFYYLFTIHAISWPFCGLLRGLEVGDGTRLKFTAMVFEAKVYRIFLVGMSREQQLLDWRARPGDERFIVDKHSQRTSISSRWPSQNTCPFNCSLVSLEKGCVCGCGCGGLV